MNVKISGFVEIIESILVDGRPLEVKDIILFVLNSYIAHHLF